MNSISKKKSPIKVAFVIPFGFETFFHFAKSQFSDIIKFENEIVSKRNTWHINWAKAISQNSVNVTIYYISNFAKNQRTFVHDSGIIMKRYPSNFKTFYKNHKISTSLLIGIKKDQPDIVFSVAHIFNPIIDMFDILSFYCNTLNIPIITRNAHADTYTFIFPKQKKINLNKGYVYNFLKQVYLPIKKIKFRLKFFVKKNSLKNTNAILTQTDIDAYNLLDKFKLKQDQIVPFPKPIDQSMFYEISKGKAALSLGFNSNDLYLLHVSNLFNTKGCEHIIESLPFLIIKHPNLKLIVAGDGPKREILINLAKKHQLEDNVIFVGQIKHKDLPLYYNLAEAFVLPTEIDVEGQPNVIMESIACNTYVITSNLPGPASIISEGLGVLINPRNHDELITAIEKALKNEWAIDMNKRTRFLNDYSLENVGNKLYKIFQKHILK